MKDKTVTTDTESSEETKIYCIGKDKFEATFYGDIDIVYLVVPDAHGKVSDAVAIVTSKEPYGMAMTEYRTRVHGSYPIPFPLTVH